MATAEVTDRWVCEAVAGMFKARLQAQIEERLLEVAKLECAEAARLAVNDVAARVVAWRNDYENRIHLQLRVDGVDVPVDPPK